MFTKEDLSKARAEKNICLIRDVAHHDVKWKDISSIYDSAESKDLLHVSFASLVINNTQKYTDKYDSIVESIKSVHGGELVGINSIIHFFNRNDDVLNDEDGLAMRSNFVQRTPHKVPENPIPYENLAPAIHIDSADGFFIQNEGSTLWTIYRDGDIKKYTLVAGDIMYIPKFTIHSVESLNPRHSTSIVFKDAQHYVCRNCGFLNIETSHNLKP